MPPRRRRSQSGPAPQTLAEWWTHVRTKGVWSALSAMSVGQIYATITTVVALVASIVAAFPELLPRPDDLVHCASVSDWPAGEWLESGKTTVYDHKVIPEGTTPAVASSLTIYLNKVEGEVQTDEPNAAPTKFTLDAVPAPNKTVEMKVVDATSRDLKPYTSRASLHVTADGCFMRGDWSDNYDEVHPGQDRQRGEVTLFWKEPASYWVRRDLGKDMSAYRKGKK
jgi:hypothetical protein